MFCLSKKKSISWLIGLSWDRFITFMSSMCSERERERERAGERSRENKREREREREKQRAREGERERERERSTLFDSYKHDLITAMTPLLLSLFLRLSFSNQLLLFLISFFLCFFLISRLSCFIDLCMFTRRLGIVPWGDPSYFLYIYKYKLEDTVGVCFCLQCFS